MNSPSPHDGRFTMLIDAVYKAATDRDGWRPYLDLVSQTFGSVAAMRIARSSNLTDVRSAEATIDPDYLDQYYRHYAGKDPMSERDRVAASPSIVVQEALISMADLRRTEFHADWMRPQGLDLSMRWRVDGPMGVMDLLLLRPESAGAFSADEQALSHALLPHLRRAIIIANRLNVFDAADAASLDAFERLGAGVLLVDARRTIRFANGVAETMLEVGDGLSSTGGRLWAGGASDQRLARAIADAAGQGRYAAGRTATLVAVPRANSPNPLSVAVSPYSEARRSLFDGGPLALVIVGMPDRRAAFPVEALRDLYDFTPAEARLAVALCNGTSLADHARASGVALTTARTHLTSIFLKSGENRQADLIRRLMNDPVLLLAR